MVADIAAYPKPSGTEWINSREIPHQVAKSRLTKMDYDIITYAIDSLKENNTEIRNKRAYLLTTVYNAPDPLEMIRYYSAKAGLDCRIADEGPIGIPLQIFFPDISSAMEISLIGCRPSRNWENAKNWLCINAGIRLVRILRRFIFWDDDNGGLPFDHVNSMI